MAPLNQSTLGLCVCVFFPSRQQLVEGLYVYPRIPRLSGDYPDYPQGAEHSRMRVDHINPASVPCARARCLKHQSPDVSKDVSKLAELLI